jgi:hypothetical protein
MLEPHQSGEEAETWECRMPAAALTPRVRVMVVCDRARPSRVEEGYFDLRGVHLRAWADSFPFVPRRLHLFLVLSSPRRGRFPAYVRVVNEQTDKAVFYEEIHPDPTFEEADDFLFVNLPMRVRFPQAGPYSFQIWFFQPMGADVLKMEQPYHVLQREV